MPKIIRFDGNRKKYPFNENGIANILFLEEQEKNREKKIMKELIESYAVN